MRKICIIFCVLLCQFLGCQSNETKLPSNLVTNELYETTLFLKNRAENKVNFHQETCADFTKMVRDQLYVRSPDFYLPKNEVESQYLVQNYRKLLHALFQLKLQIVEKYQGFSAPSFPCLENTRKAIFAIRTAEDQLLLWLQFKNAIVNSDSSFAKLDFPNVLWPEKFQSYVVTAGDIFLFPSQNPLLENMTRIFASDESYDHMGLIIQDEKGQKLLLQMHPESGLSFQSLAVFNQLDYKRIAVYRMKNRRQAQLAAQAGFMHFDRLSKNTNSALHPQYDRSYSSQEEHKITNSKIIQKSFEFAVQGMFQIPSRQTMYIDIEKVKLLEMLGISSRRVFLPIDIQFDSKFEQVAEYRKISELGQILNNEAATASFFHWIAAQKYQFRRSYPNPNAYLQKYNLIRNIVKKNLLKLTNSQAASGPLTYRQRLELADEFRAADCLRMIQHEEAVKYNSQSSQEPTVFHDIFSTDICSPKMKMNDGVL